FWIRPNISAQYDFSQKNAKMVDSNLDQHSGTVGLYVDSKIGWSVNPTFRGTYASGEGLGSSATLHAITANLSTGLELFHFIRGEKYDPGSTNLTLVLGGSFGYTDSSQDNVSAGGLVSSLDSGTWQLGGLASLNMFLIQNYKQQDEAPYGGLL